MKKINYIQDESFLHNLLKQTEVKFEKIRIFSGYMNIIPNLISTISQNIPNIEIYTSSPKANSFYKGGKFKSYIPYMYRVYEHNILQHKPKHSNIKIYEYIKSNWTFHGKGIWLYKRNEDTPSISIIGSSNYSKYNLFNTF